MSFIKSKNQSLGKIVKIRFALWIIEHIPINSIFIGLQDEFYLGRIDNTSIQFCFRIVFCLLIEYLLHFSCITGYSSKFVSFSDSTTFFGCLGLYSIYTMVNIYSINNTLFQRVVYHTIVIEESHCLRNRRCCQSYQLGSIEIFKNLSPIAINRTVTLINNDKVKEVVRQIWIFRKYNFACGVVCVIIVSVCYVFPLQ